MYRIDISNGSETEILHETSAASTRRVATDSRFTEDLYSAGTASLTVHPLNPCYTHLHELQTMVRITNTLTGETEFDGYVLQIPDQRMAESGKFEKTVICAGVLSFLQDTMQGRTRLTNADTHDFLAMLLDNHNAQMQNSPERQILLGRVTVHSIADYETDYRSTFDEIRENLTDPLGGILHTRRNAAGQIVLDYLAPEDYGTVCDTAVEIGTNLKSLSHGIDMTGVVSRLYVYGAVTNAETGERLTISSVNGGLPYLEDADALASWGVKCGILLLDEETDAASLKAKGIHHLQNSNKARHTYEASVLDLSTIGKAADSFRAGNQYRFTAKNVQIDDFLRINSRTVSIYEPYKPSVTIGDRLERITDTASQLRSYIAYEAPKQRSSILQQAKDNATELILAATTGYVVVRPNEILIMDTDSTDTATSVWRINAAGIGYAHSDVPGQAYDGPYGLAITMDGAIVADFITAGYMYADRIRGGSLILGGAAGQNGLMQVLDDSGTEICRFDKYGATIFGTVWSKNAAGYWVKMSDGSLTGGRDSVTYGTINATAEIYDGDSHITYRGILIDADAIAMRCNFLAVNGGTGTTGTLNCLTGAALSYDTVQVVTDCWLDENGALQKSTADVSVITSWNAVGTGYYFRNGLICTGLS